MIIWTDILLHTSKVLVLELTLNSNGEKFCLKDYNEISIYVFCLFISKSIGKMIKELNIHTYRFFDSH